MGRLCRTGRGRGADAALHHDAASLSEFFEAQTYRQGVCRPSDLPNTSRPEGGGEERLYNLCFSYNEAEYPYLYQELEREIQRITDSLPQRCREVFILSRFQGMKNREIAERLHISLQAVEKHIQKALRIFSEMLGRENSLYTILILLWMMNANR
ncbi:sigma-70 family RNA polymerase sigma factor [Alistipes communis]|uniref:sigma-70 family RNA polymerase sigma factor n=1 Tax=Alistipes communis TaxID=2585118 RepID=UPI003AF5881A